MQPVEIDLQFCYPAPWAREIDAASVSTLVASIKESGLLHAISVRRVQKSRAGQMCEAFEVVAGMHRVKAFRMLGHSTIPAIIRELDDLHAELMLIDENLCRSEFSPAERAMSVSRRKVIYLELHPETAHGGDRKSEAAKSSGQHGHLIDDNRRFTEATADSTGIGERTIRRDATRGEQLGADTLRKIVGTSLDKGEELDALAKISEPKRDELIARAVAGETVTAKPAVKQEIRAAREADLGEKIASGNLALPTKRYGVILADPEWKFETWSANGMHRAADNHYATSETEKIAARPIADIAAKDCVLFLWATAPMLLDALHVMAAWGFAYKSHGIWDKEIAGTGYWFRNQHEVLLVGTRGDIPAPAMGTQPSSVFREARGEHSVKPTAFHELIERWFPSVPKIELNARAARPGWDAWGAEAPAAEAAE